jgi:hypothetical protein
MPAGARPSPRRCTRRIEMRITCRCDPALKGLIPEPVSARDALPDWLRAMPRDAFSETHGERVRTVKQCPPFVDAMMQGIVIPLPCDVTVADGRMSWSWDLPVLSTPAHPRAPISFHVPAQVTGTPFHDADQTVVKFVSFWTIELEPGWSLFATHPVNRADLPFRTLSGLVDADRFHNVGILFPAIWTDPGFEGVLKRGTPVAQCFPVPREPLALSCESFDPAEIRQYEETASALLGGPGVYRKAFRAERSRPGGEIAPESTEIEP